MRVLDENGYINKITANHIMPSVQSMNSSSIGQEGPRISRGNPIERRLGQLVWMASRINIVYATMFEI